ncbi:MAG: DUF2309 domain-containing protein [Hyphomicrobium sp.]|nr:DUF2309 domain-containing protein [Hyphomicrobium sp.]
MTSNAQVTPLQSRVITEAAELAVRAIPPAWPLAATVAVNPYLGQTGEDLGHVAARLARVAGTPVTMPRAYYNERIVSGAITDDDLAAALAAQPPHVRPADVTALKAAAREPGGLPRALPTVASLAAEASGTDWPGLINERFGTWAAAYFDEGQALWSAPRAKSALAAWRAFATQDLTPEIIGLSGFASFIADAPEMANLVLVRATATLGLEPAALETYFHSLLMSLGGWSHVARYRLWQAELAGSTDTTLVDLLAIRLLWEEALFNHYGDAIRSSWEDVARAHAAPVAPTPSQVVDVILQEAAELAAQRALAETLATRVHKPSAARPALQAAFCIDVRSEVFRRALESVNSGITTLGFAGFFGVATSHRRFASDVHEHRLPVLLNAGVSSCSGDSADAADDHTARIGARSSRAWGRFKLAAVSSFAFVEATGPVYVAKLVRDALGLKSHGAPHDPAPRLAPNLDLAARTTAAETILRAMSLTENFARLVILAGHGANVTNNPHASALHCGACGGYSGEVNARLLAGLLNDGAVREQLAGRGITIPADTLFVGALHDTTTDEVALYDKDRPSAAHATDLSQAKAWLASAGTLARTERMLRLPRASRESKVINRSRDWAEVRPEWGLAGCKAFIAAPRSRSQGLRLDGRAFLHDYDWAQDKGFKVLELIMTAPVVVASWISLQYYGSTVSPQTFGGGNKLLHNVTGGIGVVEGNGGALRVGLPWQSVHDGERFMHEPVRLSVCIEAPREAMVDILKRHPGVKALFDNRWLTLFAMDSEGRLAWRYVGDLQWQAVGDASRGPQPLRAVS